MDNVTKGPTQCSRCGLILKLALSRIPRRPCPRCGSITRSYAIAISEQVLVVDHLRTKYRAAGKPKGRRDIVTKVGNSWSNALQKFVDINQSVDEINRRYRKLVVDPDTGEILRDVDEPLEAHQGRGDAKPKP